MSDEDDWAFHELETARDMEAERRELERLWADEEDTSE